MGIDQVLACTKYVTEVRVHICCSDISPVHMPLPLIFSRTRVCVQNLSYPKLCARHSVEVSLLPTLTCVTDSSYIRVLCWNVNSLRSGENHACHNHHWIPAPSVEFAHGGHSRN